MISLYKCIKKFIHSLYSKSLQGQNLKRANKLVNLVYGIIKSNASNLSKIASEMKGFQKFASKVKGVKRWILSKYNSYNTHYQSFIVVLLKALYRRSKKLGIPLTFAIDGSVTGDECLTLMISVVFKNRSLPVRWIVRKGKKGHFPEQMHVDLMKQFHKVIPTEIPPNQIVILGDGEFDGVELQQTCQAFKYKYVFRTAKNIWIYPEEGEAFQLKNIALDEHTECLFFEDVAFTQKKLPHVNVGYYHLKSYKNPLFLVSNLEDMAVIEQLYDKRFLIETFFSDVKSRGFNLQKSKLDEPLRVHRLLIALCLAYIFTIQQALQAFIRKCEEQVSFKDKNEASLFTIGRRMINFCVANHIKIRFSISLFVT